MKITFITLTIFLASGSLFIAKTFAQTPTPSTCPALYNGGVVCQEAREFRVDKKVQTPKDGSFVDRITEGETKIEAGRTIIFRIEVINKTPRTLRNISVTDTLPGFVQYIRSDASIKRNADKLTYTIETLEANKSTRVNIETKVQPAQNLPKSPSPICVANQVEARSGFSNLARDFVTFCIDNNGSTSSQTETMTPGSASAQTFPDRTKGGQSPSPSPTSQNVTKGGQTVHPAPSMNTNPNTGPELFGLIALLPAAGAGLYLRRKTKA